MGHYKMKLAGAIEISEAIGGITNSNRLEFDLQWDFDEVITKIKEPVERFKKEQQKVIEEIGTKTQGGWNYNQFILVERMKKTAEKEIEFDAEPILVSRLKDENLRLKKEGKVLGIKGWELDTLKKHEILVEKLLENGEDGKKKNK